MFATADIEAAPSPACKEMTGLGSIEIVIERATVFVRGAVDDKTLMAVLQAPNVRSDFRNGMDELTACRVLRSEQVGPEQPETPRNPLDDFLSHLHLTHLTEFRVFCPFLGTNKYLAPSI